MERRSSVGLVLLRQEPGCVVLLTLYDKSERESITDREIIDIAQRNGF